MENIIKFKISKTKQNSPNKQNIDNYSLKDKSKLYSHYNTEERSNQINSQESLSNIIDAINNNNLNLFYQDNSNFKRNIDSLNIKFYLETEKILTTNVQNSNNLFLILFKQIILYIREIERLNLVILGLQNDEKSKEKLDFFMQKRNIDFETKKYIINALKFSYNTVSDMF